MKPLKSRDEFLAEMNETIRTSFYYALGNCILAFLFLFIAYTSSNNLYLIGAVIFAIFGCAFWYIKTVTEKAFFEFTELEEGFLKLLEELGIFTKDEEKK